MGVSNWAQNIKNFFSSNTQDEDQITDCTVMVEEIEDTIEEPMLLEDKEEIDTDKSYIVYANGAIAIVDDKNAFSYRNIRDLKKGLDEDFSFAYAALDAVVQWVKVSNIGDEKSFGNHSIRIVKYIENPIKNPKPLFPKPQLHYEVNIKCNKGIKVSIEPKIFTLDLVKQLLLDLYYDNSNDPKYIEDCKAIDKLTNGLSYTRNALTILVKY